jgi:hypothetical protein
MPGAFAHITAVNCASDNISLKALAGMPKVAKRILSSHKKYVELGCVSPDFPYLALGDAQQNHWADLMHYENTGDLIKTAIAAVKALPEESKHKAFAWLCGYTAHVVADITIHPVIERKVGPYAENQTEHRMCEMHQDAYIWPKMGLGEIGLADRVKLNIGACAEGDGLDTVIKKVWNSCLLAVHPEYAAICAADLDKWYKGFQTVVDTVDEGYRLFPMARHVAAGQGWVYPSFEGVNLEFIEGLETPHGVKHYDYIFDRAVENIKRYWCVIAAAVFAEGSDAAILNWNLDNGQCPNGELTAWSSA